MAIIDDVRLALAGARYHEERAFQLATSAAKGGMTKRDHEMLTHHLRSYYWELWSVWDYLLQEANAQTVRRSPDNVNSTLLSILKRESPKYAYLDALKAIYDHPLLRRIARARHASHRFVVEPTLVESREDGVVMVISLRMQDGEIPNQVNVERNDLWFVADAVGTLTEAGYFQTS
jgi:hypothetical protein